MTDQQNAESAGTLTGDYEATEAAHEQYQDTDPNAPYYDGSDVPDQVDTDVVTHWGCQLLFRDTGQVYMTRWNPGYGTGVYVPYTEAEARADVARFEQFDKRLVTRTETTVVTTTPWVVVSTPPASEVGRG